MRLFIAILPDEPVRRALTECVESLRGAALRGSFTRPGNLHMTLAFIGESDRAADLRRAMEQAARAAGGDHIDLSVGGPGRFRREGGDVFWVGVRANPALSGVQRELALALASAGFRAEGSRFVPHFTIARRVVMPAGFEPDRTVFFADDPLPLRVGALELMKSERLGGLLTYTSVASVPFRGGL